MKAPAELFAARLEQLIGPEDVIHRVEAADGGPPVSVFFYHSYPAPGWTTAITYGLSLGAHPAWQTAKPELLVSLKTEDETWGIAAAYLAAQFRGEKPFTFQSLFTLDEPISAESAMTGFFVCAQGLLQPEAELIELPDRKVRLVSMYPFYPEELERIQRLGLKEFWFQPGYDPCDVRRPSTATA